MLIAIGVTAEKPDRELRPQNLPQSFRPLATRRRNSRETRQGIETSIVPFEPIAQTGQCGVTAEKPDRELRRQFPHASSVASSKTA